MELSIEELERRIGDLRAGMRQAAQAGDRALVRELKGELRDAEAAWEAALTRLAPRQQGPASPVSPAAPAGGPGQEVPTVGGSLVPLREQVHHALTLLTVPAAPRLIVAVHAAFFEATVASARLTSLRRDEERSFQSAPYARPYYLVPALTADRLAPVRALLSISTWPIHDRMVGPLSPRVHFLTAAIKVAEAVARTREPRPEATRLLWRFAHNIPGATQSSEALVDAARAELVIHEEADRATREAAAERAQALADHQRLFGVRLAAVSTAEDAG